jgi:hypothetical protein
VQEPETPVWAKSSRCDTANCVEVAAVAGEVMIRDSRSPSGPILRISRADWEAFAEGIVLGDFRFATQ